MDPVAMFKDAAKGRPIDILVLNNLKSGLPGAPWAKAIIVSSNHTAPHQKIFSLLLDEKKEKGLAIIYPGDKKPLAFPIAMHDELVGHLSERITKIPKFQNPKQPL